MEQQQQWRIPAFGEWNYGQCDDYSGNGWAPLTPCFDVVAVRTKINISFPEIKHNSEYQRASKASGNGRRRRRIPAFGEWNHYDDDGNGGGWPAAGTTSPPFFDLAAAQTEMMMAAEAKPHGRRRSKVADAGSSGDCAARKASFTAVAAKAKAVDDDLYGVPSDMLFRPKPAARRRGWLRILLATVCFCPGGTTCMA